MSTKKQVTLDDLKQIETKMCGSELDREKSFTQLLEIEERILNAECLSFYHYLNACYWGYHWEQTGRHSYLKTANRHITSSISAESHTFMNANYYLKAAHIKYAMALCNKEEGSDALLSEAIQLIYTGLKQDSKHEALIDLKNQIDQTWTSNKE